MYVTTSWTRSSATRIRPRQRERLGVVSDLKNPSEKKVLKAHTAPAFGVAISPDDRWLVSAVHDDQIKMWNLKTGEIVWTWKRE